MPAARRFALLAALYATAASAAPVWRYPVDSAAPVDLAVERAAVNANGTLWAFGTLAQDRALVRYATATTPDIVIPLGYFDFVAKSLVADADGGALLVGYRGAPDDSGDGSVDCHLLYVDATGRRRWETTTNPSCDALTTFVVPPPTQPDTAGERWAHLGAELVRLGGDGRLLSKTPYFELAGEVVAADARSGALYLVAIETANDLRTPVVIAQDKRGVERWRWRGTEFAASGFRQRTTLAADGSLRIAIANERGLFLVRLDADGQQRWSRKTDEPNGDGGPFVDLDTPQTDASGATWLATAGADPTRAMLRRISAAGDVVTSRTFAEAGIGERGATIAARAAPDGDLVVANGASVVRLASDGGVRYARVPGGGDVVEVRLVGFDAAGAVLATARSSTTGTSFVRLDRSGVELPAPSPRGVHSDATRTNSALLADGSIAVWTRGLIGGSRELLRVSADGAAQWRRATPGVWSKSQDVRAGAVAAGGDRVCTLDSQQRDATREHFVDCYRAADGTPLWSRPIGVTDGVSANGLARLSVDGNGAVSAWYGAPGLPWETTQVRIDANGTVVAAKTFDGFTLADGVSNDASYVVLLSNTEVAVAERGGTERYRWPRGTPAGVPSFGIGADATLVIAERSASTSDVVVTATDPTGRTRWTRTLDAKSGRPAAVAVTATSVFVGTCCVETSPGKPVRDIAALSLADGATRWRRALPLDDATSGYPQQLVATPAGDGVVATGTSRNAITIDLLDAATGAVRASRRDACRGRDCGVGEPLIGGGRVHLADNGYGGLSSLLAWQLPTSAPTRLDQPGIAGAWWSPYANGEGFVLDYLPDSRTLFMPWFTFSREGGNDPAGQRWYVVQGAAQANATEVELPITESTGGAFDAGPSVTPTIVGTATLSFTDCNNGTLRYRFDAGHNDAATGTVTLSRLSPATQNCILADGSTQTRTATPANGFDARMSGSWFEPTTSGQGMQLTVQPGGIFFAPWFTFDPAGASDDPGKQRWFTIQGSLADARNGVATLPIVQTIGGAFDSVPTNNMYAVGSATITMLACDRAKVDYRFDDNELAAAMRNRSGSIDLVKAGGCTAP